MRYIRILLKFSWFSETEFRKNEKVLLCDSINPTQKDANKKLDSVMLKNKYLEQRYTKQRSHFFQFYMVK